MDEIDIDEHDRPYEPWDASEETMLRTALDRQRATLAWKCRGLDSGAMSMRTTASSLTLGGLVKHLAHAEHLWFHGVLLDEEDDDPWASVDLEATPDWPFESAAQDDPDDLLSAWDAEVARSRATVDLLLERDGLGQSARWTAADGGHPTLRWILVHMVEEYARHNGHADLIREGIDGQRGQ